MMKYVKVLNGIVDVVRFQPKEGYIEAGDDVYAGFTYADGVFSPPPPVVIDWNAVDTEMLNNVLVENGSVVRALALLVLDELNAHAAKITAILDAADTATSLATFKTSMAAITDQPQRTRVQLVAALKARIR